MEMTNECAKQMLKHVRGWEPSPFVDDMERLYNSLIEARSQRDEMLDKFHDLECSIASALGWDLKGKTYVEEIRALRAERGELKKKLGDKCGECGALTGHCQSIRVLCNSYSKRDSSYALGLIKEIVGDALEGYDLEDELLLIDELEDAGEIADA